MERITNNRQKLVSLLTENNETNVKRTNKSLLIIIINRNKYIIVLYERNREIFLLVLCWNTFLYENKENFSGFSITQIRNKHSKFA